MNEQLPERHLYQPTDIYLTTAATMLARIFASPSPPPVEGIEVPEMLERRSWRKDETLFWAMSVDQELVPQVLNGIDKSQVTLMRLTSTDDGLIEVRSYLYYWDTGEMQVANWLFTPEEAEKMDFQSPEGQKQGQAIAEGFNQHVYTASELDYLDFLADLDGFRESYEI